METGQLFTARAPWMCLALVVMAGLSTSALAAKIAWGSEDKFQFIESLKILRDAECAAELPDAWRHGARLALYRSPSQLLRVESPDLITVVQNKVILAELRFG